MGKSIYDRSDDDSGRLYKATNTSCSSSSECGMDELGNHKSTYYLCKTCAFVDNLDGINSNEIDKSVTMSRDLHLLQIAKRSTSVIFMFPMKILSLSFILINITVVFVLPIVIIFSKWLIDAESFVYLLKCGLQAASHYNNLWSRGLNMKNTLLVRIWNKRRDRSACRRLSYSGFRSIDPVKALHILLYSTEVHRQRRSFRSA
uniref:Uncharacterized protein n=1 Tax=Glossina brevipalpis TaxID=37001 RepID=A0A1A9WXC1_9MUSC